MPRLPWLSAALLAALLAAATPQVSAQEPSPRQLPTADFLDARQLAEEGRLETALVLLDRVQRAAPADPYVRLERSELLVRVGRFDEAARAAAEARQLAPDNLDAVRLQGRVELMRAESDPAAIDIARAAFERLRVEDPEDLEALISLGQIYLGSGRPGLAADALAEADRLRPGHPGIQQLLERALAGSDDPATSARVLGERLARDPQSLATRLELADLRARAGEIEEALRLLEQTPQAQRDGLDVRRRLALVLLQAGDLERARAEASSIVEQWPNYSGGRLMLARIEVAYGNFAAAEELLGPMLADPSAPPVVLELEQRILEGTGQIERAAERLREQAQAETAEGDAGAATLLHLERARLWGRAGNWEEALAAIHAIEPGDATLAQLDEEVTGVAIRALGQLGRYDEALARAGDADPARARLAAARVGLLLAAGRAAEAEREAAALRERGVPARLALAAVLAERERWPEAIEAFSGVLAEDPADLEANFGLGVALERAGRLTEATERFAAVLESYPDFAPALNYLGYLWIERGERLADAVALVDRAVRLDPDNGAYVDSLGWGYYRQGRYTEAVAMLERAARLLPNDATVRSHLGDALLAAGAPERAAEAYRIASGLGGPDGEAAARKLAEVEGSL